VDEAKPKLLSRSEREARIKKANEFIEVVASCGRKFFRYENRVAYFFTDPRGRLWFRDAYTYKAIYVCYKYDWRGFSNGGTLRALIQSLRDYIRFGKPIWLGYFDPMRNGECYWAYGHGNMAIVRDAAERLLQDEKEEAS
jgi:hypothetical protein